MAKKKPIRVIKTKTGTRYQMGGKFVSAATVKRVRAARRKASTAAAPKKKVNPKKRRKASTKRTTTVVRKTRPRKTTKKRRNPVAKRRISAAGREAMRRGGRKGGKAAARSRKRNPSRKKKTTKRRRRNPQISPGKRTGFASRLTGKGKRRSKKTVSHSTFSMRAGPKTRKLKKYRIRRKVTKSGKGYSYSMVRANPMKAMKAALKSGALFWVGLTGMKVLNKALQIHVTKDIGAKETDPNAFIKKVAPVIPSLLGFVVGTVVLPKVIKGKKQFTDAFAMGATVAMFDAVFNTFVKPSLVKPVTKADGTTEIPKIAQYLEGYGADFTVYQPVAEYVDYDNRLGMGDYVPDNRYGQFMVQEALAADEIDYMQTGGAGGVFAKTSLGRG